MRWLIAVVVALAVSWLTAQESSVEEEPRTLRVCADKPCRQSHAMPNECTHQLQQKGREKCDSQR